MQYSDLPPKAKKIKLRERQFPAGFLHMTNGQIRNQEAAVEERIFLSALKKMQANMFTSSRCN